MGMGIQSPRIIKTHSQAKGRGERTVRIAQFLLLSSEEKGVSSLTRAEGCSLPGHYQQCDTAHQEICMA